MVLSGISVLCIDDDPDFLEILVRILESQKMIVHKCLNMDETAQLLNTLSPDVIILDLNLGTEDGRTLFNLKNEIPSIQNTPVIICSSENERDAIEYVISIGANDYILKPIKKVTVLNKVTKVLFNKTIEQFSFLSSEIKIDVEVEASLVGLSETSCVIRSNLKFKKDEVIKLNSKVFDNEQIKVENFKVLKDSKSNEMGKYDTQLSLVGLHEEEMSKVSKLKLDWSICEKE